MFSFSAINPSFPNACVNETITGLPSTTTPKSFDSNKMAKHFNALLNTTCASRGFSTEGAHIPPQTFHPTSDVTVNWNGQVWTK